MEKCGNTECIGHISRMKNNCVNDEPVKECEEYKPLTTESKPAAKLQLEREVINAEFNGGIRLPEKCMRGLESCEPYGQIVADDGSSFYCCGENDGTDREVKQDKYTICFKNKADDSRTHNDKRDLVHNAAVIMGALAVIEQLDSTTYHEESL